MRRDMTIEVNPTITALFFNIAFPEGKMLIYDRYVEIDLGEIYWTVEVREGYVYMVNDIHESMVWSRIQMVLRELRGLGMTLDSKEIMRQYRSYGFEHKFVWPGNIISP